MIIGCCFSQLRSAATITTKTAIFFTLKYAWDTNEISGRSVQAKNLNIYAMENVFLALTMAQQIITELSGAATETERLLS
jgi:hypothetical protein